MAKFKPKKLVKYHDNEKYVFVGGKAKVPGMRKRTYPHEVYITLKEFKELTGE